MLYSQVVFTLQPVEALIEASVPYLVSLSFSLLLLQLRLVYLLWELTITIVVTLVACLHPLLIYLSSFLIYHSSFTLRFLLDPFLSFSRFLILPSLPIVLFPFLLVI
jgi:hypothetical protein